jgi:regulatory protein
LNLEEVEVGVITALRINDRKKQVNIFIDGSFSFSISEEIAATSGLKVSQHLSAAQIEKLKKADLYHNCFGAALNYLSYRPRSEAEVKQRLHRRGFNDDLVDKVIVGLKNRRLVDDVAFAEYWRDNRLSFRPRSRRLLKLELRRKGVAAEIANDVVEGLDDESAAYEVGLKKARFLSGLEYREFYHYLSNHLRQRGFDYETIRSVVARLWQERQPGSA